MNYLFFLMKLGCCSKSKIEIEYAKNLDKKLN